MARAFPANAAVFVSLIDGTDESFVSDAVSLLAWGRVVQGLVRQVLLS